MRSRFVTKEYMKLANIQYTVEKATVIRNGSVEKERHIGKSNIKRGKERYRNSLAFHHVIDGEQGKL